jgi:hypothetical protein
LESLWFYGYGRSGGVQTDYDYDYDYDHDYDHDCDYDCDCGYDYDCDCGYPIAKQGPQPHRGRTLHGNRGGYPRQNAGGGRLR